MLGVRLPKDLDRRLTSLALQTKRPKSFYVKEAIAEYLEEHESIYQAVAEYERGKKAGTLKTYTLEEIKQRHGITDEDLENTDIDKL